MKFNYGLLNYGLKDSTNGDFSAFGDNIFANSTPWNFANSTPWNSYSYSAHGPLASSFASQGGTSITGQLIPGSTVAVTSGGITFNLLFDQAAMNAPASFRAGIEQAASLLSSAISDKITLNIKIDYSGTGGGAAAGPDNGLFESYSSIRSDLINHATPGDTTFNALPNTSSIQGQSNVAVWNAQLKLFGLLGANSTTTDDGSATFATDINPNSLVGVALHELTHALGRIPYGSQPDIFDLFRYTSPGNHLFTGGATAPAAYFSVDGGKTKLADFGQTSDSSDFLNSGVQGSADPFNEFYNGATSQSLTSVDLKLLDALGFHTSANTPLPKSIAVTAAASPAIQGGAPAALLSAPPKITDSASTLSGATIKITNASGSAVTGDELFINGQQSGTVDGGLVAVNWNNTTKVLTLTGNASTAAYQTLLSEITYQDGGIDSSTGSHPLRTVNWSVNDGTANLSTTSQIAIERAPTETVTNLVTSPFSLTANTPIAASALVKASDPDGDAIAKYAFIDTANGHFVLNGVVQAHNQEIDVTAAQLSGLTFQSDGGTDSLQVRVSDGTLWSAWQSFTVTGPTTTIESSGSTKLVSFGSNYFLDSNSTGTGPELKVAGSAVFAGEFGSLTPIGAEQVGSVYDVAWKNVSTNQYSVWQTDSNGNYLSTLLNPVLGTNATLESLETIFHQDLNGDGTIGAPPVQAPRATLELAGASSEFVSFYGSPEVLTLDAPSTFTGQIAGFSGNGTLAGSDQIDLRGINFNTAHFNFNQTLGTLQVSDGTTSANLKFVAGSLYSAANFKFADDGNGGTFVYEAPTTNLPQPTHTNSTDTEISALGSVNLVLSTGQDSFAFTPHFGQVTLNHFNPTTDNIQISKSVFANLAALTAATHDDTHGNAVITDAAHDTITIAHVTTAQLLAHQNDFHFV